MLPSFIRRLPLLFLLSWTCVFSGGLPAGAAGPGTDNEFQGRRVLLLGIDGCRRDVLRQLIDRGEVPHLAAIEKNSVAFWNMEAGGPPLGPKQQPTISGPGWTTICTGVFADKHGVLGNGEKFSAGRFDQYPHFFKRVRETYPQAWLGSLACESWPEINRILIAGSGENLADYTADTPLINLPTEKGVKNTDDDTHLTEEALRCLKEKDPDVLFVHFLDVDHHGHRFGFSADVPEYVQSIKKVDGHIGELIQALEGRSRYTEESWLLVVTTDHGGIEKKHGGQSREEREIFTFFHGESFPARRVEAGTGRVFQTLVTPTVLGFLGIAIDPAWELEDAPVTAATNAVAQ